MSGWMQELIQASNLNNEDANEELLKVCQLIIAESPSDYLKNSFNDGLLGTVIEVGIRSTNPELCGEALKAVCLKVPQPATVQAIQHFGFAKMRPR